MGALDQINRNSILEKISAERPAGPCPICLATGDPWRISAGRVFWKDAYGAWHCLGCRLPGSKSQVRQELEFHDPNAPQSQAAPKSAPDGSPGASFTEKLAPVAAAPKTLPTPCRCGCYQIVEVPIHEGQSRRADCANCQRFRTFTLWYGAS